jgi:hypothetical protein
MDQEQTAQPPPNTQLPEQAPAQPQTVQQPAQQTPPQTEPVLEAPKTKIWLYIITIIISAAILIAVSFVEVSIITFMALGLGGYVLISISSLILGLLDSLILRKVAKTLKLQLIGGAVVSLLCAIPVASYLFMQRQMAANIAAADTGLGNLGSLFETAPNPWATGILILLFFNVFFVVSYMKNQNPT